MSRFQFVPIWLTNLYITVTPDTRGKKICKHPYRVIFFQSAFSIPVWFGWWLLGLRKRLSRDHRKNINALTVVHPTMATRFMFWMLRPAISGKFWQKMHYADRLEELWLDDVMTERTAKRVIPGGVVLYEGALLEEGEEMRNAAIQLGVPLPPREAPLHALD